MKIIARIFGILFGAMVIIWGIMTMFLPNITYSILMWMLSITLIISSMGSIFTYGEKKDLGLFDKWTLIGSEISFALGVILVHINFLKILDIEILEYILAVWLLTLCVTRIGKSIFVYKVNRAINKKTPSTKRWWLILVFGIIQGIISIICFINALVPISISLLMGLGMLISGIDLLVSQFEN